jgi:hypothetical protein
MSKYSGYEDLIEKRGKVKIIASASDEDYQGDTLLLVQGKKGFGLLIFGWGSCSGCDAYEAADYGDDANKQLKELGDELVQGIQWFDTIEAAEDYITTGKDWEGTWLRSDTIERFKTAVVTL